MSYQTISTTTRKPCNHTLHLILTLITFGMWSPIWLIMACVGSRETTQGTMMGMQQPYPPAPQQMYGPPAQQLPYNPYSQQPQQYNPYSQH